MRPQEYEKVVLAARSAEEQAQKVAAKKEKEIYQSLRQIRDEAKKKATDEEKKMESHFAESERRAKQVCTYQVFQYPCCCVN